MTPASGETHSAAVSFAGNFPAAGGGRAPIRVCFHRLQAGKMFDRQAAGNFGGAEVRSALFAKSLAAHDGFKVSFMTADAGRPAAAGIEFWHVALRLSWFDRAARASYSRLQQMLWGEAGWLRRFDPRLIWDVPLLACHKLAAQCLLPRPHARDIYRRADVDVFCCFGLDDPEGADLAATCEQTGTPLIVFTINDGEVSEHVRPGGRRVPGTFVNGHRGWFVLNRAQRIVVQSGKQWEQATRRFGDRVTLIRNPIDLDDRISWGDGPQNSEPANLPQAARFVLWVGRSESANQNHKRPGTYWELARRLPDVRFVAVLNDADGRRFRELVRTRPPNLEVIGRVPYGQIDAIFARAELLVNTSPAEGFPNTFLQAGKHSVPVISLTVDPDSVLQREGWGEACGDDFERLVVTVQRLWNDPAERQSRGSRGRAYVEREHSLTGRVTQLAELIENIVARPGAPGTHVASHSAARDSVHPMDPAGNRHA